MISLGSITWGTGPKIPIAFAYEKQRSGANMQYRVNVTISAITGSSYFGYPIYMGLTIGGQDVGSVTLKEASPYQWDSAITYTSGWYTVSNKTSGTTAVSFKMYSGSGSSRNDTYSYTMDVDPAASTVNAPNGTLSTPLQLTVTRYNTGFTHTITYKCGTVSGTVVSNSTANPVTWNSTNGNVSALAAQNTVGLSVNVTFTITTYSGTSVVGTNTTTISMAAPADAKPSVSLKVEDAAGYLSTYGNYVQGWSRLRIIATPSLAYSSPIKSYVITADGKTYNTTPVTTGVIQGKNKLTITAKVTDTREQPSAVASTEITVLEYAKPSVTVTAYRCNSSGEADVEGSYMRVGFSATITSLNGKNRASYSISYTGASTPITGIGTSYLSGVLACNVSTVVAVEVTVTDDIDSATKSAVIPIAFTLMDFYNTGMGVALGKVATRNGFDCAMDAYFGNKRIQEVGSPYADTDAATPAYLKDNGLLKAKWVEWADVDSTKNPGWYRSKPSSAVSFGGISWSSAVWFRVDAYDGNALCQTFYLASADGYIIRRQCNGGTWGAFECFNPPMFTNTEYRTTERHRGKPVYVVMKDLGALPNAGSKTVENIATQVDTVVDAILTTANADATYFNAQEVSWYVGSYGWPYCVMKTTTNMSAYTATIKLKYTKTTD